MSEPKQPDLEDLLAKIGVTAICGTDDRAQFLSYITEDNILGMRWLMESVDKILKVKDHPRRRKALGAKQSVDIMAIFTSDYYQVSCDLEDALESEAKAASIAAVCVAKLDEQSREIRRLNHENELLRQIAKEDGKQVPDITKDSEWN